MRLDYKAMTAEVVREDFHPASLQAFAMGSYVALDSGNTLIGWGTQPAITEFRGDSVVMDVQTGPLTSRVFFGEGNGPYRAYKMDWVGRPSWGPSIAFQDGAVYLSWNSATEVESWVVVSLPRSVGVAAKLLTESLAWGRCAGCIRLVGEQHRGQVGKARLRDGG